MATTFVDYTGDGNATKSFSFPSIKEADIKVEVDEVIKTVSTHYNITSYTTTGGGNVVFTSGNIPSSPARIRIFRDTDVDSAKATYTAGSSVKAGDLNNNQTQILYAAQEEQNQTIQTSKIKDSAVTTAKIKDANVTTAKIADSNVTTAKIADLNVTTAKLAADAVTGAKIADDQIDSEHYVDLSIDTQHIGNLQITTGKIADGAITDAKIAGGSLDNRYYTETELDAGQLDNRYYTEAEADARFYNLASAEEIQSGETWTAADNKVATTAAIDARIIDLVDDVGGFVAIANETSFPTANPDVNNGAGTIVSVKAASTTLTPSGTTVTIANGAGSGNTVTITGVPSAIGSGFGFLVETTTTLHTYTFHRLSPKATEVTTVAGISSAISTAATNVADINNFADKYIINTSAPTARADSSSLQTGDLWFDSSSNKVMMVYDGSSGDGFSSITPSQSTITNINSVSGYVTFTEDLGAITDAVNTGSGNNAINTVGSNITSVTTTATSIANVNTVAAAISNVNTVGGAISNVNTVGSSIADVNRYANEYQIASSNPGSPSAGDLWYNSTGNTLNYYNGSSWIGISPGINAVVSDTSPALGGHLDCNDKNLTEVGTVSGDNLQIDFGSIA